MTERVRSLLVLYFFLLVYSHNLYIITGHLLKIYRSYNRFKLLFKWGVLNFDQYCQLDTGVQNIERKLLYFSIELYLSESIYISENKVNSEAQSAIFLYNTLMRWGAMTLKPAWICWNGMGERMTSFVIRVLWSQVCVSCLARDIGLLE